MLRVTIPPSHPRLFRHFWVDLPEVVKMQFCAAPHVGLVLSVASTSCYTSSLPRRCFSSIVAPQVRLSLTAGGSVIETDILIYVEEQDNSSPNKDTSIEESVVMYMLVVAGRGGGEQNTAVDKVLNLVNIIFGLDGHE